MLQTDLANATAARKADHLRINVEEDVAAKGVTSGFERWRFDHCALPEIDLEDVDCSTSLFGRAMRAPLLISCMTGGTGEAREINRRLARVAQRSGLGMGVGSGRVLLEHPELLDTFDVRDEAKDVPLLANIGAVQLNRGYGVEDCRRLTEMLRADALVLHLNAVQEAVQVEGDTCFSGLLEKIARLCEALETPVVVKEVGWGIAPDEVVRLLDAGVRGIDLAGAGGTSWSEVERKRLDEPRRRNVAAAFAGWGIPTAEALARARKAAPGALLVASGGIVDGIDVAKAIALGADAVGIAGAFLRTAARGEEEAESFAWELTTTLRIAMFATGSATLRALRATSRLRRAEPST
ncbi:MAG: type 2 isopentenyl-diphosphate Delta-isomerase [Candidatus Tyrphobacter sp.]